MNFIPKVIKKEENKKYSKISRIIIIVGKRFDLKKFIILNWGNTNAIKAKIILKMIDVDVKRFYAQNFAMGNEEGKEEILHDCRIKEIIIPFEYYTSRIINNLSQKMRNGRLWSKEVKKLESNFVIIEK